MNATPNRLRLARVLAVLRAHRSGARRLPSRRLVRLHALGARASSGALAEGLRAFGEGLARIHREELHARRELQEAGALVRTLLATPAPNPNPEPIQC